MLFSKIFWVFLHNKSCKAAPVQSWKINIWTNIPLNTAFFLYGVKSGTNWFCFVSPLNPYSCESTPCLNNSFIFLSASSHQLPDRDGDPAALPWHQPRPADPLFLVSCVAVWMSGEDHASQVLSLPGKEWGDQSWGPQGELRSRTSSLSGSSCVLMMMLTSCGDVFHTAAVGRNGLHRADRGAVLPVSCQVWDSSSCGQQQVSCCPMLVF